jgi:threonine dehydratase
MALNNQLNSDSDSDSNLDLNLNLNLNLDVKPTIKPTINIKPVFSNDDLLAYLRRILTAKVYDVAIKTPLETAYQLTQRIHNTVLIKREDLQPVRSFKLRGAYNKMAQLSPQQLACGVIAASAGNHAQGVALGAQKRGCKAIIVMPITTPIVKINAVKARGAEVILAGNSYNDAYVHALKLQQEQGYTFVHPFDDPDVIAGQGTIAKEILDTYTAPIDAIFVAIGGGGLIAGVAAYIKAVRPEIKVIGVQTVDSNAMVQSIAAGYPITLSDVGLFSDGTAVKQVGKETFRLCQSLVDDYVVVDTDAVCAAIKDTYLETRSIVEPSGALALAGLKVYVEQHQLIGKTLVTIACGANMNFDRLRFVAERADVGEHQEAVFAVTLPEQRGAFKRFCETISQMGRRNITEFNYRMGDAAINAHVFVGLSINGVNDAKTVGDSFVAAGFAALDLTQDELAKSHLRHLVGGRCASAINEQLYRFEFPERPGALMTFLNLLPKDLNISLFHYRNHGADYSKILIGIQVALEQMAAFEAFLNSLDYPYWNETNNPAVSLFLR